MREEVLKEKEDKKGNRTTSAEGTQEVQEVKDLQSGQSREFRVGLGEIRVQRA